MKCLLVLPFAGAAVAFAGFGAKSPMPEVQVTKVANFSWADPFASHRMRPGGKLEAACGAERTFAAREYLLHDLYEHEPRGLWPYGDALKRSFAGRPYPGGWGGLDPHLYDRPLLSMSYGDVPLAVRAWIEANGRDPQSPDRHLFAVFERPVAEGEKVVQTVVPAKTPEKAAQFRPLDARRIVIFAPGALYKILPLWVAEGECRGGFFLPCVSVFQGFFFLALFAFSCPCLCDFRFLHS